MFEVANFDPGLSDAVCPASPGGSRSLPANGVAVSVTLGTASDAAERCAGAIEDVRTGTASALPYTAVMVAGDDVSDRDLATATEILDSIAPAGEFAYYRTGKGSPGYVLEAWSDGTTTSTFEARPVERQRGAHRLPDRGPGHHRRGVPRGLGIAAGRGAGRRGRELRCRDRRGRPRGAPSTRHRRAVRRDAGRAPAEPERDVRRFRVRTATRGRSLRGHRVRRRRRCPVLVDPAAHRHRAGRDGPRVRDDVGREALDGGGRLLASVVRRAGGDEHARTVRTRVGRRLARPDVRHARAGGVRHAAPGRRVDRRRDRRRLVDIRP